ncbi:helix-turn-helix domain-containing protein [Streptomyces ortus]|uniref:Helix-turn-helix domain-containing protein n=1 Tax=Streptomyces ortus TaxID=2867268 RepID=A0ABT3V133_9ACTN|nr:helix-turn-helix domain-containing protein [Streptomyces ortus]MCX4232081.1 helix-turn-helix domain-containing protein [Streptomyces ortus]
MRVRADIAALIREGHSNASIARRLYCHEMTVARVRRALRMPPADKLGRLYAEAVPSGKVRDYRPDGRLPLSPAQQAANRNRLLAALKESA